MFGLWGIIRVCLLGASLLSAVIATWTIQNWRWEGKENAYLLRQQELIQAEAKQQADAATKFEQKQGKTNAEYEKIIQALKSAKPNATVCFDPDRLRIVNSALARTSPDTSGLTGSMP